MVVAHVTKYNSSNFSSGGLSRHIDRKHIPENAELKKQDLNFEIVSSSNSMKKDIDNRIKEGYQGKKKIRANAVLSCGVMFSGSHDQMKKIEKAGMIEEWAKDTFEFACEKWGEKNIVRATVHLDETTPHMHLHFVPLTKEGNLSAKEIISKENLVSLQDNYADLMQDYGLERGLKGSKQKHVTTKQYHQIESEIKEDTKQILEHEDAPEIIADILRENEKLTHERHLEKQKKTNPDKQIPEHERLERQIKQEKQSRGDDNTKRKSQDFSR